MTLFLVVLVACGFAYGLGYIHGAVKERCDHEGHHPDQER